MSEAVYLGHNIGKLFGSASSLMFASAEPARGRANFLCCHASSDFLRYVASACCAGFAKSYKSI